jgi:hypothetical protein
LFVRNIFGSSKGQRTASSRQSAFRQGTDRIQLIRIQPYPAAGWALVYHNRLLRTESSSHHYDVRISWAMHPRRRGDQQAVTGHQFVDQKFPEEFVCFVNLV